MLHESVILIFPQRSTSIVWKNIIQFVDARNVHYNVAVKGVALSLVCRFNDVTTAFNTFLWLNGLLLLFATVWVKKHHYMNETLTKFSRGYSYVEDNLRFSRFVDKEIKIYIIFIIILRRHWCCRKYSICISVSIIILVILVDAIEKSTKIYQIDIAAKVREITK